MEVYRKIDLPLVPVLLRMEQAGVRIDREVLREMSSRLAVRSTIWPSGFIRESGHRFNINSPKQLGDVLFNKMDLPKPMKYGKGKVISTAQDVLEELAEHHEVPALVLEYRQLQKLKSNVPGCAAAAGRCERARPHDVQPGGDGDGAASSTNPNLQNIPVRTAVGREIRAAFIAAPGNVLMSADYSQIELRLMAHFSQDPLLLEAYRDGQGHPHADGGGGLRRRRGDDGQGDAQPGEGGELRDRVWDFAVWAGGAAGHRAARGEGRISSGTLSAMRACGGSLRRRWRRCGGSRRCGRSLGACGRFRTFSRAIRTMRGFAERTAVNTPLQGTAADLIKLAMMRIDAAMRERKLKSRMTLQVHDELLFDVVPEEAEEMQALVKQEMESAAKFSVPIVAEVGLGANWRDIK